MTAPSWTTRIALAAVLLVLAAFLALTARDVLAWRGQTDRAAAAVAATSPDLSVWRPRTWLPVGVSQFLLGAGDDVALGRAIQRFQLLRAHNSVAVRGSRRAEIAEAELDLDRLAAGAAKGAARSQARTLHALLLFDELRQQTANPLTVLQRTAEELQKAVREDPTNAAAKYDLEALLSIIHPLGIPAIPGELPEKGGKTGSRVGGGGSGGTINQGSGF